LATCNAQERFNKVIFDPDGQAVVSMVFDNDSIITMTIKGVDFSNQYINFSKFNKSGELIYSSLFNVDDNKIYGGINNLHKANFFTGYYTCGVIINTTTYENSLYILKTNSDFSSYSIYNLEIIDAINAYDIVEVNDSVFAIAGQSLLTENCASLFIYDYYNNQVLQNINFDNSNSEINGISSSIITTSDKGFLIGGFTSAFSLSIYKKDWILVKTNEAGVPQWQQHFGNPTINDTWVTQLFETLDTNFVAVGGQGITNWSGEAILEGCIRKIDTLGNLVFEKFYRRYDLDNDAGLLRYSNMYISDILELEDGSFAAVLNYKRADGDGGAYRFRLFKFNSQGEIIFSRTMQNTNIVYTQSLFSTSLKQTSDHGFVINGYGEYTWDYDPEQQLWLIKTDVIGELSGTQSTQRTGLIEAFE
jgi:hypothetical protein